ncbi:MAG: hypothetical protein AAF846_26285 [Chloroflexota bacterium]
MSQSKLNSRQREERWKQAVALAKRGQYSKVRYILQGMHDEARVRKLLNQIEGRSDKAQGGITRYFNVTLVIIVVVGIAVLAITWNFTQNFQQETIDRGEVLSQYEERGLEGGRGLFENFLLMCYDGTSNNNPACVDWAAEAITNHRQVLPACTLLNDDGSIDYRSLTEADVANCLINEHGVPPFPVES